MEGVDLDEAANLLNEASSIAGGVSNAERYAADIRREMSPYVVLQSTFDRAKSVLKAEDQAKNLPSQIEKSKELSSRKKFLESVKQGYSPLSVYLFNRGSAALGYGAAKYGTRVLNEDQLVTPVTQEQSTIEKLKNKFPFNIPYYYWDSPLVKLRQAGSFNIPQEKK